MLNFKSALKQGLDAAHEAERLRREISAILNVLNDDILAITHGKVGVKIEAWNPYGPINKLAAFLMPEALVAYSTINNELKEKLADWEASDSGYPCKISIGRQTTICNDKISLVETLERILGESSTGQKILSLTNSNDQE